MGNRYNVMIQYLSSSFYEMRKEELLRGWRGGRSVIGKEAVCTHVSQKRVLFGYFLFYFILFTDLFICLFLCSHSYLFLDVKLPFWSCFTKIME